MWMFINNDIRFYVIKWNSFKISSKSLIVNFPWWNKSHYIRNADAFSKCYPIFIHYVSERNIYRHKRLWRDCRKTKSTFIDGIIWKKSAGPFERNYTIGECLRPFSTVSLEIWKSLWPKMMRSPASRRRFSPDSFATSIGSRTALMVMLWGGASLLVPRPACPFLILLWYYPVPSSFPG